MAIKNLLECLLEKLATLPLPLIPLELNRASSSGRRELCKSAKDYGPREKDGKAAMGRSSPFFFSSTSDESFIIGNFQTHFLLKSAPLSRVCSAVEATSPTPGTHGRAGGGGRPGTGVFLGGGGGCVGGEGV